MITFVAHSFNRHIKKMDEKTGAETDGIINIFLCVSSQYFNLICIFIRTINSIKRERLY